MTELQPSQPCLNCHGGRKHLGSATFMTWLGDDLVTVPNFPTWICDICGDCTYDIHALAELSMLLNPEAGTPVHQKNQLPEKKPLANTPPPA